MGTLPLTELRVIQLKHLLPSKDTMSVNSLALTLLVTHPKGLLSQVMEHPQLLKLVMEANHRLSLHMELDMEHLQHKSLLQILQFMGKPLSHPALQEAMVSQHHLCSQDTRILSLQLLHMLSQILLPVPHHLDMVLQHHKPGTGPRPMVHHLLASQVMGRRHHPITHRMVLDMHNLLPTLLMPARMGTPAGPMMLHPLLHRLLHQAAELPKLPLRVDVLWRAGVNVLGTR